MPILPQILRESGYRVGILGKLGHSTPHADFKWDMSFDMEHLGMGRNPDAYQRHSEDFMSAAAASNEPFFLMYNSHDPHRPFVGNDPEEWYRRKIPQRHNPLASLKKMKSKSQDFCLIFLK